MWVSSLKRSCECWMKRAIFTLDETYLIFSKVNVFLPLLLSLISEFKKEWATCLLFLWESEGFNTLVLSTTFTEELCCSNVGEFLLQRKSIMLQIGISIGENDLNQCWVSSPLHLFPGSTGWDRFSLRMLFWKTWSYKSCVKTAGVQGEKVRNILKACGIHSRTIIIFVLGGVGT